MGSRDPRGPGAGAAGEAVRWRLLLAGRLVLQGLTTLGAYQCGLPAPPSPAGTGLRRRRAERALWAQLTEVRALSAELDRSNSIPVARR